MMLEGKESFVCLIIFFDGILGLMFDFPIFVLCNISK